MENGKAKICAPVCVRRADDLADAVRRAADLGDLVEIRFDCLAKEELDGAFKEYARLRENSVKPFIVTFRPDNEGGYRDVSVDERIAFWDQCGQLWRADKSRARDLADVESHLLTSPEWRNQIPSDQVICSLHHLAEVPAHLDELYRRMAVTAFRAPKIAVQANDATDCIPLFQLLEHAQRDGRDLIAIAMGQAGVLTRILGPSRGSFLTYGSLDEDSATAPGQITARELREVYRIDEINRQTEIMGVIGRPVAHSVSPHIHNAAFASANANAVFLPIEVNDLNAFILRMVRPSSCEIDWNLRGLSVTAPHKSAVMKHLEWIDPAAKEIGAVNTVVVQDDALHGYNTDAAGFIAPLKNAIGSLDRVRCAVIGAGGAARAVVWALRQERAKTTVFARNAEKGRGLMDDFGVDCRSLDEAAFSEFDVVVNATPIGTRGIMEADTPGTADQLSGVRLAYDLVYNPIETQFMREAREAGCETIGGIEMLIGQAVEQSRLWTGKEPDLETMRQAAIAALAS